MLRLIKTNKQSINHLQRLWFTDNQHDLFVWLTANDTPVCFQFSYNKLHDEHTLNWHRHRGYSHEKIDNGEHTPGNYKMTPIMIPDGEINREKITRLFQSISQDIEPELATFIQHKIDHAPSGT